MRKLLRWCIYISLTLLALVVILIFSINPLARSAAEKQIRAQTGMETKIGKFDLSFRGSSVHIEDFKLLNRPEFGGGTFIQMPELFVELDRDAMQKDGKLHFKTVRINVAEVHVVEDKDGRRNIDIFEPHHGSSTNRPPKPENPAPAPSPQVSQFGGIDELDVSLGKIKYTSERNPAENQDRDAALSHRIFKDVKTEEQLKAIGVILTVQSGINIFQQSKGTNGGSNPGDALKNLGELFKSFKK